MSWYRYPCELRSWLKTDTGPMFPKDRASAIRGERSVGHSTGGYLSCQQILPNIKYWFFFDIQYVYMNILNTCTDVQFRLHVFFKWCAFIGFTDRRADNWQQNYPVLAVPPLKWLGWLKCYFSFLNVITSSRMHIFLCVYACIHDVEYLKSLIVFAPQNSLSESPLKSIGLPPNSQVVSVVFSGRCFDSTPCCCWANSVGHASTGLGTWIDLNQLWKRWAKLLDGPREWGNGIIDAKMMGSHSIIPRASQIVNFDFLFFLVRLIGCLKVCSTSEVYDQAVSCTHDKLNGVLKTQLVGWPSGV